MDVLGTVIEELLPEKFLFRAATHQYICFGLMPPKISCCIEQRRKSHAAPYQKWLFCLGAETVAQRPQKLDFIARLQL